MSFYSFFRSTPTSAQAHRSGVHGCCPPLLRWTFAVSAAAQRHSSLLRRHRRAQGSRLKVCDFFVAFVQLPLAAWTFAVCFCAGLVFVRQRPSRFEVRGPFPVKSHVYGTVHNLAARAAPSSSATPSSRAAPSSSTLDLYGCRSVLCTVPSSSLDLRRRCSSLDLRCRSSLDPPPPFFCGIVKVLRRTPSAGPPQH